MSDAPVEILSTVFHLVHYETYQDTNVAIQPPVELVLSMVCRWWREIAISSPRLWSVYRCIRPPASMIKREQDRLEAYLERSTSVPLSLTFRLYKLDSCTSVLTEMLNSAMNHASRWRCFVLVSDGKDKIIAPFQKASLGPVQRARKLDHLDVRYSQYPDDRVVSWNPVSLGNVFPHMRYLRLDVGAARVSEFSRRDFRRLVNVSLEEGPKMVFADILQPVLQLSTVISLFELPSIETISFWGMLVVDFGMPIIPLAAIEANRLKHFRIGRTRETAPLFYLLHRVSAPKLESITIQSCSLDYLVRWPPLTLVGYSFPSLQSLHLIDVKTPRGHSNAFLQQLATRTRQARKLTLSFSTSKSNLYDALYDRDPVTNTLIVRLCPMLEELAWNSFQKPTVPSSVELEERWPELRIIYTPSHHLEERSWVKLEELTKVGHLVRPPGYKRAPRDREDDPFFSFRSSSVHHIADGKSGVMATLKSVVSLSSVLQ